MRFNFDSALRYYPVVSDLKKSIKEDQSVLEVGSGVNGISDYYSGKVIGVDSNFSKTKTIKNPNIENVKGSITKVPFKDGSFKVIVCLDTFEHLPNNLRSKAIAELLRVLKKNGKIYLGFPTGRFSSLAENFLNDLFKKQKGRDHPWIKEHQGYGLPDYLEIVDQIKRLSPKSRVEIISNASIWIWLPMNFMFMVHDTSKLSKLLWLFPGPVMKILTKVTLPPFYRRILIIQK